MDPGIGIGNPTAFSPLIRPIHNLYRASSVLHKELTHLERKVNSLVEEGLIGLYLRAHTMGSEL